MPIEAEPSDGELLRELGTPDAGRRERALRELFCRHAQALRWFLASYVPRARAHEIDDLVQETFLRLYTSHARFAGGGTFRAWAFSIARNLAIDAIRRAATRRALSLDDGRVEGRADPAPPPLAAMVERHELERAKEALARLSSGEREVIALRVQRELSYDELAALIGGTPAAAKQRVFRTLEKLRKALGIARDAAPPGA